MGYNSPCTLLGRMRLIHRLFLTLICLAIIIWYLNFRQSEAGYQIFKADLNPTVLIHFRSELRKQLKERPTYCKFAEKTVNNQAIDTLRLVAEVGQNVQRAEYSGKDSKEPVTVFLIPHTHTDPGWLMTVREYYIKQVKNILNNVVLKLTEYPDMTFNWAETVYLAMWWNETTPENRAKFKGLVDKGRIEIVNGGWVAPDEASTRYYAIIDQLIEGHQWIYRHLGVKPGVGWSPDSFGYSATMPYLLRKADMHEMVIVRIHDSIKSRLKHEKNVEVLWRQTWDLASNKTDAFCHIMPGIYNSYDYSCGPNPKVCHQYDFLEADGVVNTNVRERAGALVQQFRMKSSFFRHNVIFHAIGGDFRYDTPQEWAKQYQNYRYLANYINDNPKLNMQVKFGTLSQYFKAAKAQLAWTKRENIDKAVSVLHGDWFPYMDTGNQYWSGCYTSRMFWKQLGRELEGNLRAAEILNSLARINEKYNAEHNQNDMMRWLAIARRDVALFQHHDAITGTSREHVVADYGRRLWRAKTMVRMASESAAGAMLAPEQPNRLILTLDDMRGPRRPLRNSYTIDVKERIQPVAIFNPVAKIRMELIVLRVNRKDVIVENANGWPLICQVNPVWLPTKLRFSTKTYELVFFAEFLPLSFEIFEIRTGKSVNPYTRQAKTTFLLKDEQAEKMSAFSVDSKLLTLGFDFDGRLKSVKLNEDQDEVLVTNKFMTYNSVGSGAYIFQPKGPPDDDMFNKPKFVLKVEGPVATDLRVGYDHLEHRIRVFHSESTLGAALEIETFVDMSSIKGDKEIFMRFDTSVKNGEVIYTDSNGFQMIRRKRQDSFPVGGRFYPISDACYIEGNGTRLTILSGQPNGVASLQEGQLDVTIDRKVSGDDGKGLGEGAKDNLPTISKFLLLVERTVGGASRESKTKFVPHQSLLAQSLLAHLLHPPVRFILRSPGRIPTFTSPLQPLPCDVDLVNLRTTEFTTEVATVLILHRRGFQCGFKTHDMSCPLLDGEVDMKKLFPFVKSVTETSLSLLNMKRDVSNTSIHLNPMELGIYKLRI